MSIVIKGIPLFENNYAWIMYNQHTKHAVVVDPGDANPVLQFIEDNGLVLQYILITHHHADHIGGLEILKKHFKSKVFGPDLEKDKILGIDQTLQDQDQISLEFGQANIIGTPGHTLGSICYYFPELKVIFTGDTLFSLGCGRVFEGTLEQMYSSMQKLKQLPDDVLVYCAHEYTEDNARFAITVKPNNQDLHHRIEEVKVLRQQGQPTLPTLLGIEKKTNPFLLATNSEQFSQYRKGKDNF